MPRFVIHMINSEFESSEEQEFPSADAAMESATATAADVARDQINQGERVVAIEVRVHCDGETVGRRVLSMSVTDIGLES